MSEYGDTRIEINLGYVTDAEIERVFDAVLDLLVECGLGIEADDSPVRAFVGLHPVEFPDMADENQARAVLARYARFALPTNEDQETAT